MPKFKKTKEETLRETLALEKGEFAYVVHYGRNDGIPRYRRFVLESRDERGTTLYDSHDGTLWHSKSFLFYKTPEDAEKACRKLAAEALEKAMSECLAGVRDRERIDSVIAGNAG